MLKFEIDVLKSQLLNQDHTVYLDGYNKVLNEKLFQNEDIQNMIRELAISNDGLVRARLLDLIRSFSYELSDSIALNILKSGDHVFFSTALYSLIMTNYGEATEIAEKLLLNSENISTRMMSATYLGTCGSLDSIPILLNSQFDESSDEEGRTLGEVSLNTINTIEIRYSI